MNKQVFRFSLFLLMCLSLPSIAAAQVKISAVPSSNSPVVGDEIEISINIAGGANVAGYDFKLTFSPTELKFVNIENADYLAGEDRTLTFSPTELESIGDPNYPLSDVYTKVLLGNGSVRFTAVTMTGTGEGDGTPRRSKV